MLSGTSIPYMNMAIKSSSRQIPTIRASRQSQYMLTLLCSRALRILQTMRFQHRITGPLIPLKLPTTHIPLQNYSVLRRRKALRIILRQGHRCNALSVLHQHPKPFITTYFNPKITNKQILDFHQNLKRKHKQLVKNETYFEAMLLLTRPLSSCCSFSNF